MASGLPIARVLGIEIRISLLWGALIALVTLMGAGQAGAVAPDLAPLLQWAIGAAVALGFLLSVIAHELSHALVGRRYGVESRQIVLGFIGGLAPLSIEAPSPRDELVIALVGPALSLLVAGFAIPFALLALAVGPSLTPVAGGLVVIGGLNLLLGLVSLLPGMPLDGGRVVRALAWARTGDRDRAGRVTARVGRLLGWTLFGVGAALALAEQVTAGLLVICLGWLLTTGARTLDRRVAMETLLRGIPTRDALRRDVPQLAPNLTVDTFADRYQGEGAMAALPVVDDGLVVGVVGVRGLQRLGRRRFAKTRAADVMAVPPQAPILAPGDPLWDAVDLMNTQGLDGLAVAIDGRLEGLLTRDSIGALVLRLGAGGPAAAAGPMGGQGPGPAGGGVP